MTPSEVADLLKIHLKTVYKLAEKGVIPGNRIGRSWRFSRSDVLELVSSRQMEAGEANGHGSPTANRTIETRSTAITK
jgi:excisionase family DNA binding protein